MTRKGKTVRLFDRSAMMSALFENGGIWQIVILSMIWGPPLINEFAELYCPYARIPITHPPHFREANRGVGRGCRVNLWGFVCECIILAKISTWLSLKCFESNFTEFRNRTDFENSCPEHFYFKTPAAGKAKFRIIKQITFRGKLV